MSVSTLAHLSSHVVNSETRWSYDKIESQIKNLWAIWLAEVETEEN